MKAKLIVIGGTASVTEVDLKLPTIIGRGRSADLTIPHSLVSRQHCEITERDGRLLVKDLDSLNGTYVGDERITEVVLEPGGLLTVGTVTFRALYQVANQCSPSDDTHISKNNVHIIDGLPAHHRASPDAETIPVDSPLFDSPLLDQPAITTQPRPPHISVTDQASERDTAHLIDLGGDAPLESAAPNSD